MRLGSTDIADLKLGTTDIAKVMLGTTEVWVRGGAPVGPTPDSSEFILEARVFNADTVLGLDDAEYRIAAEVYDQEVN